MTNHDARNLDDQDAAATDPTRQKVESLFKLLRGSDGPSPGDSHSVSQRFRLLRRHARGGLGDIWIAHDEELDREVALKEIQPQFAGHDQSWSRLLREATITGQLEHPGIVPIYALGQHEGGQPFYAMRFVQGDTLQDAIACFHTQPANAPERNLQRRKLVTRLIDVCNAIGYAHSRGVLHRDIKPGNIMLGEFGETQVLDWGLAKPLAEVNEATPDSNATFPIEIAPSQTKSGTPAPTQFGSAVGSPPYMSPEQASGRRDQLSPATDIYSLGATLFELLTGQAPIGARPRNVPRPELSVAKILQRARVGRFLPPSSISPDVPLALEAVCLKAMSLHPKDRYASASDLAADLEAWLADEPITAGIEPLVVRCRRWMRRHQTAVVSTAAAALVALVTLSVLAFVVTDRNDRLATAKGNLQRSNDELAKRNGELAAANKREQEQAQLAVQRANELDRANQQVRTEAENSKRLADESRTVLDFFQEKVLAAARPKTQAGGLGYDATIRAAVDAAEPQIASAFQGQPLVEASIRNTLAVTYGYLGEHDLSIQLYEKSRQLRSDHLGVDHPDTLFSMAGLAYAYQAAGKFDEALTLLEQTLEKQKAKLGVDHPHTLFGMGSLADAYKAVGKLDQALPLYEQTLEMRKAKLGVDHPDTVSSMVSLAHAYRAAGKFDEALPLYEQTLPLHEQTLEMQKVKLGVDHPDTLLSMCRLAAAYQAVGKLDKALPLYEQTLEKQKARLGVDHPHTLFTMAALAFAYQAAGKSDLALGLVEQTLEKQKAKLGVDHPDTLTTMHNLASAYYDAGKFDLALPLYEQTLEKEKAKFGVDHPHTLFCMGSLAAAYHRVGKLGQALPLYEQTLEMQKVKLAVDHPDTLRTRDNLGNAYHAAGKFDQALRLHQQTLEMRKAKLGVDHPETLLSMGSLSAAYIGVGKLGQALSLYEQTLEKQKARLGVDHPHTLFTMVGLASAYQAAGKLNEAEPLWRELVAFAEVKAGANSPEYASHLASLSLNLLQQKKFIAAEPLIRECQTIERKTQTYDWRMFNTTSMLGGSLLGQKKYSDAEPLLLAGYEGMKKHEAEIPAQGKIRLTEAVQRLVDLYDATDQKAKATLWRKKLPQQKPADPSNN